MNNSLHLVPPDQLQREQALDPARSILVQAPAGSGKTDLLTRRFLRLLAEVESPGQIVAITFTIAAAAEMRDRILSELEKAAAGETADTDEFSMQALARRALERSKALGWKLLDLPAQLRISTIDAFCRDLAQQQPLVSGMGGNLSIAEQPNELYLRAARETLQKIDATGTELGAAIESLLRWRDNNWQELEELLVQMLAQRDRWMHGFVLDSEQDWQALRAQLELPFAHAIHDALTNLDALFHQAPGAREEILALARFACEEPGDKSPWSLAESVEFSSAPFFDDLASACEFYSSLSSFLQTKNGSWRSEKGLKTSDGFPSTPRGRAGKARFASLIATLNTIPDLEAALANIGNLPACSYTENEWKIVRACFTLLRHAAAELQVVFAEAGAVDFIEVAQIAQRVLEGPDGLPTDAALAVADGIHHLLVDEFQDTSRRQHRLLASLVAAWPEHAGRTCFVVGDPMQSIYFFREADAELFERVKTIGLELPSFDPSDRAQPLLFDFVPLRSNFRTAPPLVEQLNASFTKIFAADDGSSVAFSAAEPARHHPQDFTATTPDFSLHLEFVPQTSPAKVADSSATAEKEAARQSQIDQIVALIQSLQSRMEEARTRSEKFRIAILARAKNHLLPIAQALHTADISFRALELEKLSARAEILDALALARALLNPYDRVAWLGVLRAPWCALSLDDLHRLASADDRTLLARPVPELLAERLSLLSDEGRIAAARVLQALSAAPKLRAAAPAASLGSWLEEILLRLGGAACVDATARANLDLLWSCLDRLPAGEQDLLGPSLDAALDKLAAQPDPAADSSNGVQLMTIHKSKGLEFEVVIVPELQALGGRGQKKMLSWLERGLAPRSDAEIASDAITEFLVAPIQSRGAERGSAKNWVDRVYRSRELQEDRRVLYVAATRAREALHLFARPAYKLDADGSRSLAEPANSLLKTAWPALEDELRTQFNNWKSARDEEQIIESIAASGESTLLQMPSSLRPTQLRRLPSIFQIKQDRSSHLSLMQSAKSSSATGTSELESSESALYSRHEGGLVSRALGTAVHSLLQELARLRATHDWPSSLASLESCEARITAQIRAYGIDPIQSARISAQAIKIARNAAASLLGQWILSPHSDAASETAWTGIVAGSLCTVRIDRVFRAGAQPQSKGDDYWWIIDYKTAHTDNLAPAAALPELRRLFAPQLETYAAVLRNLHGKDAPIRAALYYPRIAAFDWWQL